MNKPPERPHGGAVGREGVRAALQRPSLVQEAASLWRPLDVPVRDRSRLKPLGDIDGRRIAVLHIQLAKLSPVEQEQTRQLLQLRTELPMDPARQEGPQSIAAGLLQVAAKYDEPKPVFDAFFCVDERAPAPASRAPALPSPAHAAQAQQLLTQLRDLEQRFTPARLGECRQVLAEIVLALPGLCYGQARAHVAKSREPQVAAESKVFDDLNKKIRAFPQLHPLLQLIEADLSSQADAIRQQLIETLFPDKVAAEKRRTALLVDWPEVKPGSAEHKDMQSIDQLWTAARSGSNFKPLKAKVDALFGEIKQQPARAGELLAQIAGDREPGLLFRLRRVLARKFPADNPEHAVLWQAFASMESEALTRICQHFAGKNIDQLDRPLCEGMARELYQFLRIAVPQRLFGLTGWVKEIRAVVDTLAGRMREFDGADGLAEVLKLIYAELDRLSSTPI